MVSGEDSRDRARVLAALRELAVEIDFGWPIWRSAFIYDHERDGL